MFKKSLLFTLLMAFAVPLAMWGQTKTAYKYVPVTSLDQITTNTGDAYVIACPTTDWQYGATATISSGDLAATTEQLVFNGTDISNIKTSAEWTFEKVDGSDNQYYIKNGTNYLGSNSSKYLRTTTTTYSEDYWKWTIAINDGVLTMTNVKYNTYKLLIYKNYQNVMFFRLTNSTYNVNNIGLYKKTEDTAPSVTVSPESAQITKNGTITLTATVNNAPGATVYWSSDNTNIATVSATTGTEIEVTGQEEEGLANITATITVNATDYTATCAVTVSNDISMKNGSFTLCDGNFYDNGGSANNYSASQTLTTTLYPGTSGNMIQVTFNSFTLESGSSGGVPYDYLTIYDGTSTSATQIGDYYSGSTSPGTVTASNSEGALTFYFKSDGGSQYAGWTATISCVAPAAYEFIAATDITHNSATVNWTGGTAPFTVQYKAHNDTEWTTALASQINDRTCALTDLATETAYDVQVTDANNNVISEENYFTTTATPIVFSVATDITSTSATVNWTGGKANYKVEYKPNGSSTWILAGENISANSCELTGLSANTSYDVRVIDALNSIFEQESYFTTECGAYAIPYSYGFETATDMECWSTNGATTQTGIYSTTGHNNSTKVFKFHYSQTDVQYLISPELSGVPTYGVKVTFYYKLPYTSNPETFKVGYSTTDNAIASFEGNWDDEISYQSTAWKEYSHVFPAETKYIAINYTAIDKYQLYIDDISFEPYAEYTKGITGYTQIGGDDENEVGWYLIASPVLSVTPTEENGFLANDYDFYRFNQNPTVSSDGEYKEWENYKTHNFVIESGKGYLYANSGNVTLQFAGVPYSGDGKVDLVYSASNGNDDEKMLGWNLVGNPFGTAATVSMNYYRLGQESRNLIAGTNGTTVEAMEGILVKAGGEGENVTFIPATQNANTNSDALVVMNLTQNRGTVIDRAIVRFNENGNQLPKFMLDKNNTKIYIPQNGEDFAIAYSNAQGEMPVNFKARENGTYTLSVNAENVEMNYLHLIDNMTGTDVDLLSTPSYTFNATTSDYESRFRLVFSANDENGASTGSATFAFFSNGNLVVSNEGEATLQVVDLMGRVLSSETINGSHSMSLNVAPGVYMIRLINGNNVKVQKIVVR